MRIREMNLDGVRKPPIIPSPSGGLKGRLGTVADWELAARMACFSGPELARQCHVSLRHLQRHFRENYGLKLRQWLNQLRLTRAFHLIREGARVKEVAFTLGYKQLSHFSREFKLYHGMTPSTLQAESTHSEDGEAALRDNGIQLSISPSDRNQRY
jgi:AraC-like DNA-binding protein